MIKKMVWLIVAVVLVGTAALAGCDANKVNDLESKNQQLRDEIDALEEEYTSTLLDLISKLEDLEEATGQILESNQGLVEENETLQEKYDEINDVALSMYKEFAKREFSNYYFKRINFNDTYLLYTDIASDLDAAIARAKDAAMVDRALAVGKLAIDHLASFSNDYPIAFDYDFGYMRANTVGEAGQDITIDLSHGVAWTKSNLEGRHSYVGSDLELEEFMKAKIYATAVEGKYFNSYDQVQELAKESEWTFIDEIEDFCAEDYPYPKVEILNYELEKVVKSTFYSTLEITLPWEIFKGTSGAIYMPITYAEVETSIIIFYQITNGEIGFFGDLYTLNMATYSARYSDDEIEHPYKFSAD